METSTDGAHDVMLPRRALTTLRKAVRKEAGPLASIQALQAAGYEVGGDLFDSFAAHVGEAPTALGQADFWRRLGDFFVDAGWGSVEHTAPHGGVGVLTSPDWVEAGDDGDENQPACSFSSGLLAGLLTKAAGGPVAVLQVACRARGDDVCTFAFGSQTTVQALYARLLDGATFETALEEL